MGEGRGIRGGARRLGRLGAVGEPLADLGRGQALGGQFCDPAGAPFAVFTLTDAA